MNDVYIMRKLSAGVAERARLDGIWPDEFDAYETLLRIGPAHGHSFRFAGSQSAIPVVIDLVGQRPEISDAEIAQLLRVPLEKLGSIANEARAAVAAKGYPYPWRSASSST